MFNLIIKDIFIQKKTLIYAILYTVFFSITFYTVGPSGLGLYVLAPIVVTYMFITNAVNYDEKNKSEIILNSLPIKRAYIVISKYMSTFIFVIISSIYSILIGFIGKSFGFPMYNISIRFLDIILVLTSVCIFSSVFFPVYFKFGYIKARIYNIMLYMVIFFLPILTFDYISKNPNTLIVQKINYFLSNTSRFTQNSLAIVTGLIFFLISLMISIRIYNNKEF